MVTPDKQVTTKQITEWGKNLDFNLFSDGNEGIANRLRERHKRIIVANLDAIQNKKVIDIAANNGRWTYAALAAGATSVLSIEGREERVADAIRFLDRLGFSEKYQASVGDMYDFLYDNRGTRVDTVFCLGIYYHVMDHSHFLRQMARMNPTTIIIDSAFVRSFRNSVHVQTENPSLHLNALSLYNGQKAEPVGFISLGLMIQMAWNLGYTCRPVTWDPIDIENPDDVHDYMMGRRFTLRLEKMSGHYDKNWMSHWRTALVALNAKFEQLFNIDTHDLVSDDRARRPVENSQFTILS